MCGSLSEVSPVRWPASLCGTVCVGVLLEWRRVVQRWLNELEIVWYEGKQNLNWNAILKQIRDDPQGFVDAGGFDMFLGDDGVSGEEGDSDEDDDDEEYAESGSEVSRGTDTTGLRGWKAPASATSFRGQLLIEAGEGRESCLCSLAVSGWTRSEGCGKHSGRHNVQQCPESPVTIHTAVCSMGSLPVE